MTTPDELQRENAALRERIAGLSTAILRISDSLDLDTVLHEIVEAARALTGARYCALTTVTEDGQLRDLVTAGLTPDQRQRMLDWPDGPRLFEHLRELRRPLRVPDFRAYIGALGLGPSEMPAKPVQGTPMRHRGMYAGAFFVCDKLGGQEFAREDEELLVMFASQAATAIANARTHRDEQRARADLEALVDTTPVAVVVFDARTAEVVSLNQEGRRLVDQLCRPGQSAEHLLQVMTSRRADPDAPSLGALPLAEALRVGETVRNEEMVLSGPNGRSVNTLVNATPIKSADGNIESVVITAQDLAPLEEVERSRTEFLSLVSHELRAPLISIKGAAATVLGSTPAPDPAEVRQIFRIIDTQADHMRGLIGDLLDAGRIETGTLSVAPEPTDAGSLVEQSRDTFLSGGGRHTVLVDLPLDLPLVLADRQRIVQVLNNLLANAARNAPESSPIRIAAVRDGVHVAISVTDEGRGVAPDRLPHLFSKHARVRDGEDRLEGTGLGLSICKGLVEAHGGRIRAESGGPGMGARMTFTLPVAAEAAAADVATHARAPLAGHERPRILVVDDDPQSLRYVRDALGAAGYAPVITGDPHELPGLIKTHRPQLVVLDLMLPGTDGIELLQRVPALADVPVVFISAYGRDETIARALEVGGVDYIVKPFSPTELTARVAAALRRRAEPEPFMLGGLAVDYGQRRVTVGGEPVQLTATEFELLRALSVNAGRVMSYEALMRQTERGPDSGSPMAVRAHVKKLRRKLGDDAAAPTYIFTERGVGYSMARPGET